MRIIYYNRPFSILIVHVEAKEYVLEIAKIILRKKPWAHGHHRKIKFVRRYSPLWAIYVLSAPLNILNSIAT